MDIIANAVNKNKNETPSDEPLLIVAVSSRALFDFEDENRIFEENGVDAYKKVQQERLDSPAKEGHAYRLVEKLLRMNHERILTEVVILSRNDPITGLRVFRTIAEYQLEIRRGVFTRGANSHYRYLKPLRANLFLSADAQSVRCALDDKIPAAHIYSRHSVSSGDEKDDVLKIAFDGDAVLFSDESERVYKEKGLARFVAQEEERAKQPMEPGPFKPFITALDRLRRALREEGSPMTVRTALVTARGAPAHERAINTLSSWGIEIDEAMFLNGDDKADYLKCFAPDIFFDDQIRYCNAQGVSTGHVNYGVRNRDD